MTCNRGHCAILLAVVIVAGVTTNGVSNDISVSDVAALVASTIVFLAAAVYGYDPAKGLMARRTAE